MSLRTWEGLLAVDGFELLLHHCQGFPLLTPRTLCLLFHGQSSWSGYTYQRCIPLLVASELSYKPASWQGDRVKIVFLCLCLTVSSFLLWDPFWKGQNRIATAVMNDTDWRSRAYVSSHAHPWGGAWSPAGPDSSSTPGALPKEQTS